MEELKMKDAKRELYIDGVYSAFYDFDWKNNKAIYRQAVNGEAIYVNIDLEK